MKYLLPFLLLPSCGLLSGVSDFVMGPTKSSGGEGGGVIQDATNHIWLVWIVGPILLSLFFKEVREPIGAALSAFFGLWAALWARLTGLVTKDPND